MFNFAINLLIASTMFQQAQPQSSPAVIAPMAAPPVAQTPLATSQGSLTSPQSAYSLEVSARISQFPSYTPQTQELKGVIRISGSASMAPILTAVGEGFSAIYPKVVFTISQGGSSKGIQDLRTGQCDLAAVSRDLSAAEIAEIEAATKQRLFVMPVAIDAICIYVNADNPLPGITREQLNGIFSITHRLTEYPIMRWSDLDPSSPLKDAFIPLYIQSLTAGTMQEFQRFAMPNEGLQTVLRFTEPAPSSVVNACCAFHPAIGIAGYINSQPRARMLPVSKGAGEPFIAPSFATLSDGSYPMTRNLNLLVLAPNQESIPLATLDFFRFIWSEAGQDVCATLKAVVPDPKQTPAVLVTKKPG